MKPDDNFLIRDAVPEDAADIARIHNAGWEYAYRGILSDEYLDSTLAKRMTTENIKKLTERLSSPNPGDIQIVAVAGNTQIVGMLFYELKNDKYKSGGIYVDPKVIGTRVGYKLFNEFIRRIHETGHEKFWVSAASANKTVKIYEKMGGIKIREFIDTVYGNIPVTQYEFNVQDLIKRFKLKG